MVAPEGGDQEEGRELDLLHLRGGEGWGGQRTRSLEEEAEEQGGQG